MGDADTLLRDALDSLVRGRDLDTETARAVMDRVMEGRATPAQIGALLAALRAKGESVDELTGMAASMRDHAVRVELSVDAVDTCGTGGDGSGTFNISTAAAFVVAGAGTPVAKHGGRAASSRCGSADVLEALGVVIQQPPDAVRRCVEEAGIGFLFAPAFHPAMRHAAPVRSELGIRTVFNVLGPLANPARVRHQALGVGDARLAESMAAVLRGLRHEHALVIAGAGGLDELALDAPSRCHDVRPDGISELEIDPAAL
ncbi:MAG TPA: anthranilate phosphoribosyltransferase, partial [Candidatus Dormibacteraeota bacterium]|nr:anthranilate phosphoribosyltransferase [Candidatus Dormibacteraeota bacterium]